MNEFPRYALFSVFLCSHSLILLFCEWSIIMLMSIRSILKNNSHSFLRSFTSTSVWWWNYQQLSILSIIYVNMRIHDEWTIKIGCFSLMMIIRPFRRWFADVVSGSSVFFSFPLPTIWFNTQHTISNYYEWSLWNDDDSRLGTERDRESERKKQWMLLSCVKKKLRWVIFRILSKKK